MSPEQLHPSREDLFAYRDGELKADRRAVIEAHVVSCHVCRELIDEVSRLEGDLRIRAADPGGAYFERMTEQVMEKLPGRAAGAAPMPEEVAPIMERRRSAAEMEWEAKRTRAPRLPWVALISTASAAATVVVIGVLLIRQGAVLKHPPKVSVLERSAPDAARRAVRDSSGARDAGAGKKRQAAAKEDARGADRAKDGRANEAKSEADEVARLGAAAPTRQEEKAKASGEMAAEVAPAAPQQAASKAALDQAAPSPTSGLFKQTGDPFAALLQRYELPPIWNPGISDESVLRAEPALRNLYRTGGLGTPIDSARARLYLAEAARVKSGSSPDSATADEIIHHYQRAIRLASGDDDTRRVAAQRLQEFLEERAQAR